MALLMRWLAVPFIAALLAGLAYWVWPRAQDPAPPALDPAALAAALAEADPVSARGRAPVPASASAAASTPESEPDPAADSGSDRAPETAEGIEAPLRFPDDHAPHPGAPGELWDLSAMVEDADGRRFGLRLTLARLRLVAGAAPPDPAPQTAAPGAGGAPAQEPAEGQQAGANASAPERLAPADPAEPAATAAAAGDTAASAEAAEGAAPEAGAARGAPPAPAVPAESVRPGTGRDSALAATAIVAGRLQVAAEDAAGAATAQRVSRTALGLAGAEAGASGRLRVWVEDWSLTRRPSGDLGLAAAGDDAAVALRLWPVKAPVGPALTELLGDGAESARFGAQFYALPRLGVAGELRIAGRTAEVTGTAWLEHGWGRIDEALSSERGQLVANRFLLQLDDGSELSCLHLRRRTGGGTPIPSCLYIGADGATRLLRRRELTLAPTEQRWRAPDGTAYPLHWRLAAPALGLMLEIRPLLEAQTLPPAAAGPLPAQPWSGAVGIRGERGDDALGGSGRMDLNGYGGAASETRAGT